MIVWLWYTIGTFGTLVLGVYLVVHGWRGRRHGGEPRCRKCDYNLTGIESQRCPECGTKLGRRTIVHGARQRSWVFVVCGGLVLMLGLLSSQSTLLELKARRHLFFTLGMLVDRAAGGDQQAMVEIEKRIKRKKLSEAQAHRLAERALLLAGPTLGYNDPWWLRLVELDEAGLLLDEHRTRMAARATAPWPYARSVIRQGDPIIAELSFAEPGLPGYWRRFEPMRILVGEHVIYEIYGETDRLEDLIPSSDEPVLDIQRYVLDSADLPVGATKLVIEGVSRFAGSWETPATENANRAKKERLEASITILAADSTDPVTWVEQEYWEATFGGRLRIFTFGNRHSMLRRKQGGLERVAQAERVGEFYEIPCCRQFLDALPVPIAMEIIVEVGGIELPVELVHVYYGGCHHPANGLVATNERWGSLPHHIVRVPVFDEDEFYIILRSSKDVARHTLDMYSLWHGELRYGPFSVLHDVADASP